MSKEATKKLSDYLSIKLCVEANPAELAQIEKIVLEGQEKK